MMTKDQKIVSASEICLVKMAVLIVILSDS